MAIKAGMTIAQAIAQLTKGFVKVMKRQPEALEKIKIQQEAVKKIRDLNKVVDMEGNVIDTSKGIMGGREIKAMGGRIGYKDGPDQPGRRKFMKIMGGLATIPFVGKFFKGAKTAAPAVEKAAEVAGQAPSYFFDLVAKIKTLGRMSDGPSERIKEYSMKGKDGKSEFLLSEDISTGEMQIKKIGKESDDMITDVQTMEYTPGSSMADETTKGIPADNYEEFTEFQSRIYKDEFNDPDIVDGIKVDEIIEEIKDQAPSIKKASGGIARMLGE
jgi:hypothetical protein